MARSSEQISKANTAGGRTDSNLSNDTMHVGGIPAEDMASKKYVQDYHDAKEELLKQYIDQQDATNLEEAKGYTDTVVANQDFSGFAKLTDLQTLNQNLNNKINTDISNLESSTDTKINNVADDVAELGQETSQQFNNVGADMTTLARNITQLQSNLEQEQSARQTADSNLQRNIGDLQSDVTGLQQTTQELFTSVSNGKRKVAAAITGKGVQTASDATFDTMATNIGLIEGLDTSDATATENDIMLGKTAYVNGYKRYGTHVDLDTSDATATQEDIKIGKSAYIDGVKVYGSHIETGVDTSDATATPYDIKLGKTAYVNGEKIVGALDMSGTTPTYNSATGIEKIYGGGTGDYSYGRIKDIPVNYANILGLLYNETYKDIVAVLSSSGTTLGVHYVANDDSGGYIGMTRQIDISSVFTSAQQQLIQQQYSDYQNPSNWAYRFIGITKLDTINPYIAYQYQPSNVKESMLILLPLIEVQTPAGNGAYVVTWEVDFSNIKYHIIEQQAGSIPGSVDGYMYKMSTTGTRIVMTSTRMACVINIDIDTLNTQNIYSYDCSGSFETGNPIYIQSIAIDRVIIHRVDNLPNREKTRFYIANSGYTAGTIKGETYPYVFTSDARYAIGNGKLYSVAFDFYNDTVNFTELANCPAELIGEICFVGDLFIIANGNRVFYFDPTSNEPITYIEEIPCTINMGTWNNFYNHYEAANIQYSANSGSGTTVLNYFHVKPSQARVIGLRYNGEYYYKESSGILTAGQPDVRKGKTFIGWMGYPETGTMEIEEEEE